MWLPHMPLPLTRNSMAVTSHAPPTYQEQHGGYLTCPSHLPGTAWQLPHMPLPLTRNSMAVTSHAPPTYQEQHGGYLTCPSHLPGTVWWLPHMPLHLPGTYLTCPSHLPGTVWWLPHMPLPLTRNSIPTEMGTAISHRNATIMNMAPPARRPPLLSPSKNFEPLKKPLERVEGKK